MKTLSERFIDHKFLKLSLQKEKVRYGQQAQRERQLKLDKTLVIRHHNEKARSIIDASFLSSVVNDIRPCRVMVPCCNKQIVTIQQRISSKGIYDVKSRIFDLLEPDIASIKLGLCMCVHERYDLTRLCLQYLDTLSFEKIIICYSQHKEYENLAEFHNNKKFFFCKVR